MLFAGPAPHYGDLPVMVDMNAAIPVKDARILMTAVSGLVARLASVGADVDNLPPALVALADGRGYRATLVGRPQYAIELSISERQVDGVGSTPGSPGHAVTDNAIRRSAT